MTEHQAHKPRINRVGGWLSRALPVESMEHTGFPGRWLGGASMVIAPLVLLTGVLLRVGYDFFFPAQLTGFAESPGLMTASYSCFIAGYVLLWPGVLLLANRIARAGAGWALWGGALVMLGIFARAFHAGIDHLAFQLVDGQGAASATEAVARAYPAFHVFSVATVALFFGWVVLALAAWRTGVLRPVFAVALALTVNLPIGVLKGTTVWSIVAAVALCVALVPSGIRVLAAGPRPATAVMVRWIGVVVLFGAVSFLLGQAG